MGVVESVNLNRSPAPEAVVELSAPISSLEWVVVSPNPKADTSSLQELNQSAKDDGIDEKLDNSLDNSESGSL